MRNLNAGGWPGAIERALSKPGVAMLGICLGMQLLADVGHENGETKGLGLVAGEVARMSPSGEERLPHVGWNEIRLKNLSPLLHGIESGVDFYFVHSYRFEPADKKSVLATTPYCGEFASIVQKGNVFGTQFHPEKSSHAGFRILRNFLTAKPLDA
jgi:glutamine amidotransferase